MNQRLDLRIASLGKRIQECATVCKQVHCSLAEKRIELFQNIVEKRIGRLCDEFDRTGFPIEALNMVYQHNSICVGVFWQDDFKWVSLLPARNGAADSQARRLVEDLPRQNESGAAARLLVSRLWIEIGPNNIAAIRNIGHYQISLPTGGPVSHSSCRFSGVICATSSSSL